MTRTIVAIASSIAVTLAFGSAAQACISCEYVPEVLKSGESGGSYRAKPSKRVRDYTEQRERRSVKKRVTTGESEPEKTKTKTSTASANAAPAETAQTEHSAITTTGAAIASQVKAAITPEPTGPQSENSTISTVAATPEKASEAKPVEQVAADKNVGCKKYFPSTGLTLSVPCE